MKTRTRRFEIVKEATSVMVQHTMTADEERSSEVAVPDGANDQLIEFFVTLAQVKWLFIVSDVAITLESFDGASAGESWTLAANHPLEWAADDPRVSPLTHSGLTKLTKLLATNASGDDATLKIEFGYDLTP